MGKNMDKAGLTTEERKYTIDGLRKEDLDTIASLVMDKNDEITKLVQETDDAATLKVLNDRVKRLLKVSLSIRKAYDLPPLTDDLDTLISGFGRREYVRRNMN